MLIHELRIARKQLNLTQKQLAKLFGVSSRSFQRWENGINPIPKWMDFAMRNLQHEAVLKLNLKPEKD